MRIVDPGVCGGEDPADLIAGENVRLIAALAGGTLRQLKRVPPMRRAVINLA
ncbi:MAG: hypothetical protein LBU32_25455 [Clostridiales bacterium]|nr:hypothetical protein [Clostridiales bacterium]